METIVLAVLALIVAGIVWSWADNRKERARHHPDPVVDRIHRENYAMLQRTEKERRQASADNFARWYLDNEQLLKSIHPELTEQEDAMDVSEPDRQAAPSEGGEGAESWNDHLTRYHFRKLDDSLRIVTNAQIGIAAATYVIKLAGRLGQADLADELNEELNMHLATLDRRRKALDRAFDATGLGNEPRPPYLPDVARLDSPGPFDAPGPRPCQG